MSDGNHDHDELTRRLREDGRDVEAIQRALGAFAVETPSWGYGDSGTRFATFRQPARPRNVFERLDDAAEVHRLTGAAPAVALHFPWDAVDDLGALRRHAADLGLRVGAVNPNLFQDPRLPAGLARKPRSADPSQGGRAPARVRRHRKRAWLDRPVAVARRRHQLPGPGRPCSATRARCGVSRAAVRRAATRPGVARRVQVLRARLLRHRYRGLGLGAADLPGGSASAPACWSTSGITPTEPTSSRSSR